MSQRFRGGKSNKAKRKIEKKKKNKGERETT
jgi:hypothetical protein